MQADHVLSSEKDGYSIETIAELFDMGAERVRAVVEYGRQLAA